MGDRYDERISRFRSTVLQKFQGRHPADLLADCLDVIEARAGGTSIGSAKYLEVSLENLLTNEKDFNEIFDQWHARRLRREKWMPSFDPAAYSDEPDPELTRKVLEAIGKKESTRGT
jgi:hypothetical protein